ncbi:MAG: hypothetical protein R3B09_34620 [Nannocystaceae bacterium]
MMKPSISSLTLLLLASGCATDLVASALSEVNLIDDTTSTGDDSSGSTWSGPVSTVTSATTSASSSSGDAGDTDGATSGIEDTTSGDADAPPMISKHELSPNPIKFAGPIEVKIWINGDADGVRMALDSTDVELTLDQETQAFFTGEIPAYSGLLQNSDEYVARFTPWRDDGGDLVEGDALEVPYAIQLHDSGDEDLWALDKSSSGHVTALDVLPEGDVLTLQTLVQGKMSSCSLRRRDPEGNSGPDDVVVVLPDRCRGISLEVGDDGVTQILIEADTNLGWMWAVARMTHFGAPLQWIADGEVDEVARDLAVSPSGVVAVCGSTPTPEPGDLEDAVVHIVRPDEFSSYAKTFDYKMDDLKHKFDERANGCTFVDEDRVILVGSVYGPHVELAPDRSRRFDVVYNLETDHGDLRVASAGLATQGFATDVAVDHDEGRIYVVGHVCGNDVCDQVEAQMWTLDGEGDLASTTSLGLHSNKALAPSRVRVSPVAGYILVASGGLADAEGAFLVRAYAPFKAEPLWSYLRHDADLVHLPNALAIGPYGQVYAGGFGANGFPLFVIIYG